MEYITTKEASEKWNISERRIRKLLKENRIEGATKLGNTWNIPSNSNKPTDKRITNFKEDNFIIDINEDKLKRLNNLKTILSIKEISKLSLFSLKEEIYLEWIFNSNAIEGNTLTLRETQLVLETNTAIGGKPLKDHLEAVNHEKALDYLDYLVSEKNDVTEWNIKLLHDLILKGINDESGKYREANVRIKGAKHIPPDYIRIPELMNNLINRYHNWKNYHPIIQASLFHGELVKIHPFIDGNGRTSRLLMNMILMLNNFVPIVIKVEDRIKYYESLDKAHITNDYTDFTNMLIDLEIESLENYLSLF